MRRQPKRIFGWRLIFFVILGCLFALSSCKSGHLATEDADLLDEKSECSKAPTAPRLPQEIYDSLKREDPLIPTINAFYWVRRGTRSDSGKPFYLGSLLRNQDDLANDLKVIDNQFEQMNAAYKKATDVNPKGVQFFIVSSGRTCLDQINTFNKWKTPDNSELCKARPISPDCADNYSARPGLSEHQLGVAFDIGSTEVKYPFNIDNDNYHGSKFGRSPAGEWLRKNAHCFGFTMSYPWGQEATTCYNPEPWHWRYVGPGLAKELMRKTRVYNRPYTLEEYFREKIGVKPNMDLILDGACPNTNPLYKYDNISDPVTGRFLHIESFLDFDEDCAAG